MGIKENGMEKGGEKETMILHDIGLGFFRCGVSVWTDERFRHYYYSTKPRAKLSKLLEAIRK